MTERKAGLKAGNGKRKMNSTSGEGKALNLGLCKSCVHVEDCRFRRHISQAVIECHEFGTGPAPKPTVSKEAQNATEQFRGLCINCDIRHECNIPKPAEGVWHCKDYV